MKIYESQSFLCSLDLKIPYKYSKLEENHYKNITKTLYNKTIIALLFHNKICHTIICTQRICENENILSHSFDFHMSYHITYDSYVVYILHVIKIIYEQSNGEQLL